jgi:DNA-binding response OmpR family regulator
MQPFMLSTHTPDRGLTCRRPIAYVSLQEPGAREQIATVLDRAGWTVIFEPSGFHLIQAIADVIEGRQAWRRPDLIVVDARSPGCAGTTIAAGLRELGITIPIVVIDDTASAAATVASLAREASPYAR